MNKVQEELFIKQKMLDDAHLGIIFKYGSELYNPLRDIPEVFEEQPELYFTWLMSRPEYFYMACKCLMKVKLHPFQGVVLQELWNHKFPMLVGSRGMSKTFSLAIYALLRALFLPRRKILICSAGFRQAKLVFGYIENFISDSSILRNMIDMDGGMSKANEGWELKIGESSIRAIPLGDGSRIRGLRANDILADEFDSIPVDVFETVVAGFAAVSASPTDNAARIARKKLADKLGIIEPEASEGDFSNQIIISGTAGYSFNHFSKYHDRYLKIIKSRGNPEKLKEVFGDDIPPRGFNHKDFSVIRIPVNLLPEGFMDDAQIARAKATVHSGIYQMEYCAVFSSDSNGFFPRSIIEKATIKSGEPITIKNVTHDPEDILFLPKLYGNPDYEYIMGIDPAMSSDNFAIVILEIHSNHRRVVYCWTTNESDYLSKKKAGVITETNYYAYCIRKIRDLYRDFNIKQIALDKDGGGRAILEGINDEKLMNGEEKLLPIYLEGKVQETDCLEGKHIIELVNFSKEEYTSKSNHGLRKDMEERELLFPLFDAISIAEADINISMAESDISKAIYKQDNDENKCILEIEELKNELCTIVVTKTAASNRERFDTPEIKTPGGRKGRMHKDRYSALLMANMTARTIAWKDNIDMDTTEGGFATQTPKSKINNTIGNYYSGPEWLTQALSSVYK